MKKLGRPCRRDPAPREIQEACAEIRNTWDERTFRIRAGFCTTQQDARILERWWVPLVETDELGFDIDLLVN